MSNNFYRQYRVTGLSHDYIYAVEILDNTPQLFNRSDYPEIRVGQIIRAITREVPV